MTRHPDRSRMSIRELITEAERREIAGAEWMDRAALLRALEEGDGAGALGALARARKFLGQVTGLDKVVKVVRGAIDPARPEAPALAVERPRGSGVAAVETAPEPAAAAELEHGSERRGDPAPTSGPADDARVLATPDTRELLAGDLSFGGMRVVSKDGRAWLVWRASGSRVAAILASSARGELDPGKELTLRLVSVGCAIGEPDAEVVIETADESGLALEGVRPLPDVHGRPCVAAIGVGRGAEFVSVAHARVA